MSVNKRILFVDDEPKVLDGIRRTLRMMRHEWEMDFASGGEEALAKLAESSFDVIVSDMLMPKMDGMELLKIVKEKYPKISLIALSGQCSEESFVKTVNATDYYLSKPCDLEVLIEKITALDMVGNCMEPINC